MKYPRCTFNVIDEKCLVASVVLAVSAIFFQTTIGDKFFYFLAQHTNVTVAYYVLLSVISVSIVVVILLILRRVLDINKSVKKEIAEYVEKTVEEEKFKDIDLRKLPTHIKNSIRTGGLQNIFLLRYTACFISVIIGYAAVYKIIFLSDKGSFFFQNNPEVFFERGVNFIYFSFVTVATLGYGDIAPISCSSRVAVIFEIIIGIVFLVLMLNVFFSSKEDLKEYAETILPEVRMIIESKIEEADKKSELYKKRAKELKTIDVGRRWSERPEGLDDSEDMPRSEE